MEWVKIEKRSEKGINCYYIAGEIDNLIITQANVGDAITCRLSDGSTKNLVLKFKSFEVVRHEDGIPYHAHTKKWFVTDDKDEYPIDEIEVLKDDIMRYQSK